MFARSEDFSPQARTEVLTTNCPDYKLFIMGDLADIMLLLILTLLW